MFSTLRSLYSRWKLFKRSLKERKHWSYLWIELAESLAVAAAVVLLIVRPFIIQVSVVPTGSMIPTIQRQDRLFVLKFYYRFFEPKQGDIIVFASPTNSGPDYVKRCVALPGDTLHIDDGIVYINGKMQVFPGVVVLRDLSNYGPVTLPEDRYFMLGDNRAYSSDSRYWGFVNRSDILGKAWFTFWPLTRMQLLY